MVLHPPSQLRREGVDQRKTEPAFTRWPHALAVILDHHTALANLRIDREHDPDRAAVLPEGVFQRAGDELVDDQTGWNRPVEGKVAPLASTSMVTPSRCRSMLAHKA